MAQNKVLIDTNICLDAILRRKPFSGPALELVERSEKRDYAGFLAAHCVDTLYFILRKRVEKTKAYQAIKALRKAFTIAPISRDSIDTAIEAHWDDLEDAIHHEAAREAGCNCIITRNRKDFRLADLPIYSPTEFLKELHQ